MGHGIGQNRRFRVAAAVTVAGLCASALLLMQSPAAARSPDEVTEAALIAQARSAAHLAGLTASPALDALAHAQTVRMVGAGTIFHNPNLVTDLRHTGLAWTTGGENVGVGPTLADVHRAFLASPEHRANLLNQGYNAIGVGVVRGADGRLYVTQVFAQVHGLAPCRYFTAEDGSRVPASFYGLPC